MADKVVIVEIQYDTDIAIKNVNNLTAAIEGEKVMQAKLKSELEEGTISQNDYSKAVEESKNTQSKANTERKNTIQLLSSEKGSVNELKANIKTLTAERDKLNLSTKEGQDKAKLYNAQIKDMQAALKGAGEETKKTGGAFATLKNDLGSIQGAAGGVIGGIQGIIKASLAFIATPIGAFITLLVGAFMLLKKAFMGTEENQNKLNKVTNMLSGAFNALLAVVRPVAEFIFDKAVKAFEFLGQAAEKAMGLVSKGLKLLGFKEAAAAVENFTTKIKDNVKASTELADAEAKLKEQQRLAQKVQLDYQKQAEKLRQLRDDEANSISDRMKSNEKLGKLLKEQSSAELAIAYEALKVADLKIKTEGKSTENLDRRAEALTTISDIQERISGQESEQLSNLNALRKEQQAAEKTRLDTIKANADKEIETNKKVAEEKKKLSEEEDKRRGDAIIKLAEVKFQELELETKSAKDKADLQKKQADEELARSLENTALLHEEVDLLNEEHKLKLAEIDAAYQEQVKAQHQKELDDAFDGMQQIIAATQGMGDARVTILSDTVSKIATINFAELKSSKDTMVAIGQAATGLTSLMTSGHEEELASFENAKAEEFATFKADSEARLLAAGDDADKKALIEAELKKEEEALNKKYSEKEDAIKEKQFKDDKAKAVIDATIATILAVTKSLPSIPLSITVGALGAANIFAIAAKQYTPTKKYAKGGIIGGNSHANGGTNFFGSDGSRFEAEAGEALFVMKKDATAEIAALSAINESFGGRSWTSKPSSHLADGGEASGINLDKSINEAISRTPIYVRVADIETGMTDVKNVKSAGVI